MSEAIVVLEIDGKKIPMNEFVNNILYGMIAGSVSSLHGVKEDWKNINISINR